MARAAKSLAALAAAGIACGLWWSGRATPVEAPAPRWRNGIIVEVRHCEHPADDDARVRCAALYCAQRVTRLLTNAQQATLTLDRYERDAAGVIQVAGSLDQYLPAPTLPTGFTCSMANFRHPEPKFVFGRHPGSASVLP